MRTGADLRGLFLDLRVISNFSKIKTLAWSNFAGVFKIKKSLFQDFLISNYQLFHFFMQSMLFTMLAKLFQFQTILNYFFILLRKIINSMAICAF